MTTSSDWLLDATNAFNRRWVNEIVTVHRGMTSRLSEADKRDFRRICDLDPDVPFSDALDHAEKLLVVWKVSARLSK